MALACADCGVVHDFDMGPDDGECLVCKGPLVENKSEREKVVGGLERAIVGAVADGLTATALIRGKAGRGQN
jgi:hypothetical protein